MKNRLITDERRRRQTEAHRKYTWRAFQSLLEDEVALATPGLKSGALRRCSAPRMREAPLRHRLINPDGEAKFMKASLALINSDLRAVAYSGVQPRDFHFMPAFACRQFGAIRLKQPLK